MRKSLFFVWSKPGKVDWGLCRHHLPILSRKEDKRLEEHLVPIPNLSKGSLPSTTSPTTAFYALLETFIYFKKVIELFLGIVYTNLYYISKRCLLFDR